MDLASIQKSIDGVTSLIGTLVPTIGAIGTMTRLVATAVRPTDAQKAQEFDAAIAEFDMARNQLGDAVKGFEAAKAAAAQAHGGAEGKPTGDIG